MVDDKLVHEYLSQCGIPYRYHKNKSLSEFGVQGQFFKNMFHEKNQLADFLTTNPVLNFYSENYDSVDFVYLVGRAFALKTSRPVKVLSVYDLVNDFENTKQFFVNSGVLVILDFYLDANIVVSKSLLAQIEFEFRKHVSDNNGVLVLSSSGEINSFTGAYSSRFLSFLSDLGFETGVRYARN